MDTETYTKLRQIDEQAKIHRYSIREKENVIGYLEAKLNEKETVSVRFAKRKFDYIVSARFQGLIWSSTDKVPSIAYIKLTDELREKCQRLNNTSWR